MQRKFINGFKIKRANNAEVVAVGAGTFDAAVSCPGFIFACTRKLADIGAGQAQAMHRRCTVNPKTLGGRNVGH